jgi:hypothetical protein
MRPAAPVVAAAQPILEVVDDDVMGIELEETVLEPKSAQTAVAAKPAR